MKTVRSCGIVLLWMTAMTSWCALSASVATADDSTPAAQAASAPASSTDEDENAADHSEHDDSDDDKDDSDWESRGHFHLHHPRHDHDIVNIGHNSDLPAGQQADSLVSVFGSSTAYGDATDVVSVFGNTKVTGSAREDAVAVLGSTTVDGPVGGDVVAVLGNVQLGPNADVRGDVVAVGGQVDRDPDAKVHGTVQTIGGGFHGFTWLKPWIDNCLLYGRPLALVSGIGWAWSLALGLFALYVFIALLFRDGVSRCVRTLDTQPGMTFVAALITVILTPIALVLLCITFVGVAAIPFLGAALFCTGLFGKAVMLAWLGHRALGARGNERFGHPAIAAIVGGLIVLVLYLVPVVGFIAYQILGLLGFGAVVYTLVLLARERRTEHSGRPAGPNGVGSTPGASVGTAAGVAAAGAAAATAMPGYAVPPSPQSEPHTPPAGAPPDAGTVHPSGAAVLSAAGLPRAGFWIRMIALLLDAVLVGILMGMLHHGHAELLVLAIYGAIMWKLRGATLGGIVFDLQVVRLDDRPVDWETAIVRALGCFLSMAVVGLGFFWIGFDPGKQAWHDKIAGTAVVRVRKGAPLV